MENVPPPAEELAILDHELSLLEARRAQLLARRAWLLGAMRPHATAHTAPVPAAWPPFAAPPPETSPPNTQNVLLTLGGILLTVAAVAFTLVSWGHLGIGGRSAVLGAVTVAALAAPVALLRHKLVSTAESVAALGLVLMVLDAYALHRVALPDTEGLGYAAFASAALAALWSAYGLSLDRLRIPLPVAVLTAQLPLPLWALTAGPGAPPMEWALLATAALDVVAALWAKPAAVRAIAGTGATTTGGWALLTGGWQSATADTPLDAGRPAVLLLAAAAVALLAAWRAPWAAVATAAVAGLAMIAAVGGVVRAGAPEGWAVVGYLLCAVAVLAVLRARIPFRVSRGLTGAAAVVHAAAVLSALPLVALTLMGPVTQLDEIWSGAPADARGALGLDLPESGLASAPVVLLVAATVLTTVSRWWPTGSGSPRPAPGSAGPPGTGTPDAAEGASGPSGAAVGGAWPSGQGHVSAPWAAWAPGSGAWGHGPARISPGPDLRAAAARAALGLAWAAVLVLPAALDLGYPAAVALHLLLTATMLTLAVRPIGTARTTGTTQTTGTARHDAPAGAVVALVCGLVGAVSVALLALAARPATFAVLGALFAALATAAPATRGTPVRAVLACAATVFATGLIGSAAAAAGLPPHRAALVILAVPVSVALLAARLGRHPVALPLELTGAAAGLLGVGLAAQEMPTLALVLALLGVIAAGTAVRPERRPAAGYLAAVLFVLAAWVRLAASDVASPEAYTLPVTVPALVVGWLRRRRDPEASSWTAYGPALAATLLPSLVTAWGDEHWQRPLLLGLAALAITLAGARLRLRALLMLGGTVLALDALHELAPYVVQVVGALPRWLPPALAGLLLLAVGATYEQRLRDARKLRDTLGRMR
jgi:hypothetical protein